MILSVTGLTKNAYMRDPGDRGWTNLGGGMVGAPAVAHVNGLTHIIAQSRTGYLVHRTQNTGYHPITTSGRCRNPSAAAAGTRVTIACIGMNRHGYTLTFDGTQEQPALQPLRDIGGGLDSIEVMHADNDPVFAVTGGWYTAREGGQTWRANTYVKDETQSSSWQRLSLPCDGPLASTLSASHWFSSCQTGSAMSVLVMDANKTPEVFTVPGRAAGKIGIAPVGDGSKAVLAVQGLDGYIRYRHVTMNGSVQSHWTQLSGAAKGGVAAAPASDLG
ncbi:MAG: hypothetical protein CSA58_06680 [Micrococcales bacterium]|nr:MAG: hypothetical protein CSA58_06680 [Micrococcales bacterium]